MIGEDNETVEDILHDMRWRRDRQAYSYLDEWIVRLADALKRNAIFNKESEAAR